MSNMPYIVGICGGSASGKTFLLRQLLAQFSENECALISQDNYYKPKHLQVPNEEGLVNFDHPDSLDLDAFVHDVKRIIQGETIQVEEYTFNNPHKIPKIFIYHPTPLLILEGILIFHKKELVEMMDLKIFIDADDHIRLTRRLLRDVQERNYTFEETLRDYNRFVAPMYNQYVEPTKKICDIIIPNHHSMRVATDVIINHLKTQI